MMMICAVWYPEQIQPILHKLSFYWVLHCSLILEVNFLHFLLICIMFILYVGCAIITLPVWKLPQSQLEEVWLEERLAHIAPYQTDAWVRTTEWNSFLERTAFASLLDPSWNHLYLLCRHEPFCYLNMEQNRE